jgi:hypothetical protein
MAGICRDSCKVIILVQLSAAYIEFCSLVCSLADLGLNPGCRGGKPATNHLSYGTVLSCMSLIVIKLLRVNTV